MIGHNFTYTGPITASESTVVVTTFTTSTKMTYLYQLVDESSMRASSVSDYSIEDYVANGISVKYIFDMVVVQYKDLDGQEESDIHLERHPCNIANLPWTNVVYVYLKGELVMEIYYCSPYELSITCFLQLIPRYLQKFYT